MIVLELVVLFLMTGVIIDHHPPGIAVTMSSYQGQMIAGVLVMGDGWIGSGWKIVVMGIGMVSVVMNRPGPENTLVVMTGQNPESSR